MVQVALLLLLLTAPLGVWLGSRHLAGVAPARTAAHAHGAFAASAILILGFGVVKDQLNQPGIWGLVILAVAALGGALLSVVVYRGKHLPGVVIAGHAGLALIGALLVAAFWLGIRPAASPIP